MTLRPRAARPPAGRVRLVDCAGLLMKLTCIEDSSQSSESEIRSVARKSINESACSRCNTSGAAYPRAARARGFRAAYILRCKN